MSSTTSRPSRRRPSSGNDGQALTCSQVAAGRLWLAVAWFGASLLVAAMILVWPIIGLAAMGCPSGGDCGPGRALLQLFAWTFGAGLGFAAIVLGLGWLAHRTVIARIGLGILAAAALAVPVGALVFAVLGELSGLLALAVLAGTLVPALSIGVAARTIWVFHARGEALQ